MTHRTGEHQRRRRTAFAVITAAVALAAAAIVTLSSGSSGGQPEVSHHEAPLNRPVTRRGQPLSVDQLAGERVIYAYGGLEPPASLLSAIKKGEAAGVILFAPNISSPEQLAAAVHRLQRAALASPIRRRLLILTDQEGGEVRRLPGEPALSEKEIGQSSDPPAVARTQAIGAAANLVRAGVNVNLAPVLDVYRAPGNFIDQYGRSYSSDATAVGGAGAAFIASQQEAGVVATAKHFPGLGAATQSQNTDAGPVTLDVPLTTLHAVDELPYRQAIGVGVKLVMTSWATYPALDPQHPAGLSSIVIDRELRQRLHFQGVTITDGMDAGAVTPFGSLKRRSVLAAQAGADLLLCASGNPTANTPAEGLSAVRALAAAIRRGYLRMADSRAAAARVLALRLNP